MSDRFWDVLLGLGFVFALIGTFVCGWFARDYTLVTEDPERYWEGSAEWVAVSAIENDNIILKKLISDTQAHYDSMVCFRPGKSGR